MSVILPFAEVQPNSVIIIGFLRSPYLAIVLAHPEKRDVVG